MSETASAFKVAQVFGITSSVFLSGFAFSASYLGMPALDLAPPAIRVQQWLKIYDLGKLVSPTVGTASGIVWAYVTKASYESMLPNSPWKWYGFAGLTTFSILPWTVLVMMPTNKALMKMASEKKTDKVLVEEGDYEQALSTWNGMNYIRAALPMIGAVGGLWGALM